MVSDSFPNMAMPPLTRLFLPPKPAGTIGSSFGREAAFIAALPAPPSPAGTILSKPGWPDCSRFHILRTSFPNFPKTEADSSAAPVIAAAAVAMPAPPPPPFPNIFEPT